MCHAKWVSLYNKCVEDRFFGDMGWCKGGIPGGRRVLLQLGLKFCTGIGNGCERGCY